MNLTIAKKLAFGLGILCVLDLTVGYFTYSGGQSIKEGVREMARLSEASMIGADLVKGDLRMSEAISQYLLNNTAQDLEAYKQQRSQFIESLAAAKANIVVPERAEMVKQISADFEALDAAAARLLQIIPERNGIIENEMNPAAAEFTKTLNEIADKARKDGDAATLGVVAQFSGDAFTARAEALKYIGNRKEEQLKKAHEKIKETAETGRSAVASEKDPADKARLEHALAKFMAYAEAFTKVGALNMERNKLVHETIEHKSDALAATGQKLLESFAKSTSDTASSVKSTVAASGMVQMSVVGVATALGVFMAVTLTRSIVRPIRKVIASAEVLASGNLTERLDDSRKDELGLLSKAFNQMTQSIATVIGDVQKASSEVASAAGEIAASAEEMAAGMQRQAEQTAEVSAAVSEMSASVQEVASRSAEGRSVVEQTVNEMKTIATQTEATSAAVNSLGKKSEEIGRIVSVINDIADQTNLLALNAAIEAARAGEHGRGFAVVADEVRKLAERTTEATQEIASSIRQIQAETTEAVQKMQTGTERVGSGVKLAQNAGESLAQIVAATTEQAGASEQIARNVERINAVTKESKDGAGQAAAAASQLSANAEQLQALIGRFKLS